MKDMFILLGKKKYSICILHAAWLCFLKLTRDKKELDISRRVREKGMIKCSEKARANLGRCNHQDS